MQGNGEMPDLFELIVPDNEHWLAAQKLLMDQGLVQVLEICFSLKFDRSDNRATHHYHKSPLH